MNREAENTAPGGKISPLVISENATGMIAVRRTHSKALGTRPYYFVVLVGWLAASTLTVGCEKTHGPAREPLAVDSVRVLLTALAKFRDAYPAQGYPETLSDLGPGPPGSRTSAKAAGLIDGELASGVKNGYRFFYIPGPSETGGAFISFAIVARPLRYEGIGTPSFFANEIGIIRRTTDDRAATDADPPVQND